MSKLAIIGTLELQPGSRDEVLKSLLAHRERCLRDEPGTLQLDVLIPQDSNNKILLYEVYTNADAFAAHFSGPSLKQAQQEVGSKLLSLSGVQCGLAE